MAAYTPTPPSGGAGFSLKLKLGSVAPSPPVAAAVPEPSAYVKSVPAQPEVPVAYYETPLSAPATAAVTSGAEGHREASAGRSVSRQSAAEEKEARGVSSAKYRELKRKYEEAVESRDEMSLALFRSQKLIHRLREERSSLLDRILQLESAAGLTSAGIEAAQEQVVRSAQAAAFPLLNPPALPSLADRPRPTPILNTSTDLSHSSYNDPIGEPPRPLSDPPRQRSQHIRSQLASEKLRMDTEARRIAHGLPKPAFPAVAVLGLEGSYVAENVERAMRGEAFGDAGMYVQQDQKPVVAGNKRRRESESATPAGGSRSRSRAAEPQVAAFHGLPNPFAGAGAMAADEYVPPVHQEARRGDIDMDDGGSVGEGAGYSEDEQAEVKEYQPKERKHRKLEGERTVKPKRLKTHGITSGTYNIPHISRNADGTPRLPLPIGIMILRQLGTVDHREHFHTERYIFPIGFEAMRQYPSMIDPAQTVEYACCISDGGDGAPRFEIHPADQPGFVISAGTPTGAWSQVVKAANIVRERNHSNSVSGPDYFGLSQNVVKALIQELPGARETPGYIWQTFVEDPDPATLDDAGKKGKRGDGPKKVTGAKRKARLDSEGQDDGGYEHQEHQQYHYQPHHQRQPGQYGSAADSNTGYESSQRSPSPITSPGALSNHHDGYNPPHSSSLSALLHHAAEAQSQVASDPYALPGAAPVAEQSTYHNSRSPSYHAASPYAIPGRLPVAPPQPDPYAIPTSTGPSAQPSQGGWGEHAIDPMFQDQAQSAPPPSHQQQHPSTAALDPSFY